MKCPICDGGGRITSLPSGMPVKCTRCNGTGEIEQTNEEWLRSCTEFELIELLADLVDSGILKRWAIKYHCADDERRAVELWLKEKHK